MPGAGVVVEDSGNKDGHISQSARRYAISGLRDSCKSVFFLGPESPSARNLIDQAGCSPMYG